jgi:hypothetical protein
VVVNRVSKGRPRTIRDGTSHYPFVPGQKYFFVPLSLFPGTRAGAKILRQTPLSQDKITFPKKTKKQEKDVLKQEKYVLKQEKYVLKQEKMF